MGCDTHASRHQPWKQLERLIDAKAAAAAAAVVAAAVVCSLSISLLVKLVFLASPAPPASPACPAAPAFLAWSPLLFTPPPRQPVPISVDKSQQPKASCPSVPHLHNKHATLRANAATTRSRRLSFSPCMPWPKLQARARRRNWNTARPTFCKGGTTVLEEQQAAYYPSG